MGSQFWDILRQGIWASFTGGWYYEPKHSIFTNTFHLYLWLILLCLPFFVHLYVSDILIWLLYSTIVSLIITIIKCINWSLHCMFDTTEYIVEEDTKKDSSSDLECRRPPLREPNKEEEGIEMQILGGVDSIDKNEPSTSGTAYHQNESNNERQSSSTSTDSGLHLQEKSKSEFSLNNNQIFVEKPNHVKTSRPYERGDLKSFSEIWKYQDERRQDFITVSTDCFPNDSNNSTFQRDPKSVSSDYSTCSDVFSKDKDLGKTSSYQLVFTSSDIVYPIVEHCEEHSSNQGIIHTIIDSDDDDEAGSRSPLLTCHVDNWKLCSENVNGVLKMDSDIEVALIDVNKPEDNFLKQSVDSPENFGLDWLFEHTESESEFDDIIIRKEENIRLVPWHFTFSDDDYTTTSEDNNSRNKCELKELCREDIETTPKAEFESSNALAKTKQTKEGKKSNKKRKATSTPHLSIKNDSDRKSHRRTSKNKLNESRRCRCDKNKSDMECGIESKSYPTVTDEWIDNNTLSRPDAMTTLNVNEGASSSAGSHNELSSLLPASSELIINPTVDLINDNKPRVSNLKNEMVPESIELGSNRIEGRSRMRQRHVSQSNRHARSRDSHNSPFLQTTDGVNFAACSEDTSDGAVHFFRDENGQWMTYTFRDMLNNNSSIIKPFSCTSRRDESSDDLVFNHSPVRLFPRLNRGYEHQHQFETDDSYWLQNQPQRYRHFNISPIITPVEENLEHDHENIRPDYQDEYPAIPRQLRFDLLDPNVGMPKPKRYYPYKPLKTICFKIRFDRLALLTAVDRNLSLFELCITIALATTVAVLGAFVLYYNFYQDIQAFIFCFVIAGCQYSLIKSVQPDVASPTHGFNKTVVYSRPVYFILFSSILLLTHLQLNSGQTFYQLKLYGFTIHITYMLETLRDFLKNILLFLPIAFSLGLLPQVNTFFMYALEQTDIHLFGGNATSSLKGSAYCVVRSCLAVSILYGIAYVALYEWTGSSRNVLFSLYCAILTSISYHLSRSSSDPAPILNLLKTYLWPNEDIFSRPDVECSWPKKEMEKLNKDSEQKETRCVEQTTKSELDDEIEIQDNWPKELQDTINGRLKSDLIFCPVVCLIIYAIHSSNIFLALQPELNPVMWCITFSVGFVLHYIIPQLRKQLPWLCIAHPILKPLEYNQYEVKQLAKIMWFEKVYVYLCFFERNVLYPLMFIGCLTSDSVTVVKKLGTSLGSLILSICALKCFRCSFSQQSKQYNILAFAVLFFQLDYLKCSETFIIDYYLTAKKIYVYTVRKNKIIELQFVITYIAPWQITWGSAFHAFAQPFSVPHSAMMFLQAFISAVISSPLYPFLGSAIFLTSYPRPVKFWERDYNTRRVDHTNTKLSSHLERNLGADDNNLNSIFYEHLTRLLQHTLCGDLIMGRWGNVSQGDCFVLASDYLNCLVHIVEMGNNLVTFQMRGLEFRGTYCQQREVEAISEGVEDNEGCCCCEPGHFPHILSLNAALGQRWLAWQVVAAKYVVQGYSISDINASSMLQVFDFRKVLVSYYVKSIIYYAIRSPKLPLWLASEEINEGLKPTLSKSFVDLDPVFNINIDEDYDLLSCGITRNSFCSFYLEWIRFCAFQTENIRKVVIDKGKESILVSLCFALSLLGRRSLGLASHTTMSSVEFFLYGLHALFKGDFRITSTRDEWIFADMDLMKKVLAPAIRMSLKLHQNHFMVPDEYEDPAALYNAINYHQRHLVISHEGDPVWRNAVLSGMPSLLALRHIMDEGSDEYKVIMLNKRFLSFRVIKINRECVRGLWAGQQQELIYLRNRNPERGSIQNAKQALRNIINSSCDQPIGYPIFVSPLTTSYAETNEQLSSLVGGSISLREIKKTIIRIWTRLKSRCVEGCSSGSSLQSHDEGGFGHDGVYAMTQFNRHSGYGTRTPGSQSIEMSGSGSGMGGSISSRSGGTRGSTANVAGKPNSAGLANLAGLLSSSQSPVTSSPQASVDSNPHNDNSPVQHRVLILDPSQVYDAINLGRRIDVVWPDEKMRIRGGRSYWKDWLPEKGMEGLVVHQWIPNHRDLSRRSHVDKTILLIKIDERYVPIAESGVLDLGAEV
ncbi:pecanex-like protein 1 [Daktulosphaira vitifoliae]|uniref:pecanex-like protein 1 n=1 Tax=Daktulosphaira vitifoliae TaxID=58002 RepID=UPI0021AA079D|nr:pecanex-like protein 1 [Daktulosphaira vitifoliae]